MSGNDKLNERSKSKKEVVETPSSDSLSAIYDINREVRMISESLAACKKMSTHRSKRDMCVKNTINHQTQKNSVDVIPKPREPSRDFDENTNLNTYNISAKKDFNFLQKSKAFLSREEILSKTNHGVEELTLSEETSRSWSVGELGELSEANSTVCLYRHEDVDPMKLIDIIQRELKSLMDLVPNSALIISGLSDVFFHYKGCPKCTEKIKSFLPWILSRIQKLIKYVVTKNRGVYNWPNDYNYIRVLKNDQSSKVKKEVLIESVLPEEGGKCFGISEKVKASAVSECMPGIQIQLEVVPEKIRKRFYELSSSQSLGKDLVSSFPTLCLNEPSSNPIFQVVKPSEKPVLRLTKKKPIVVLKEFSLACNFLWLRALAGTANSVFLHYIESSPSITRFYIVRPELCLNTIEGKNFQSETISDTGFIQKNPSFKSIEKTDKEPKIDGSDTLVDTIYLKNISYDPDLQETLEDMKDQKVKELEIEVKDLKNLMLEVHKNQIELSKVLTEKEVCSQHIIKLTDPNVLEEENLVVKKATLEGVPGRSSSSVENLQLTVDDLKRKCSMKNKLIVTLLKGLRSDAPKECWEELVDYFFSESKPAKEFDPEKISEFIRQTSYFLMEKERAQTVEETPSRKTELPTEEVAPVEGNAGEEVEFILKNLFFNNERGTNTAKEEMLGVLLERAHPIGYTGIPAVNPPAAEVSSKVAIQQMENQIALLNLENDRLWYYVSQLREMLKNSVTEVNSNHSTANKQPGKTINFTIQIGEKDQSAKNEIFRTPSVVNNSNNITQNEKKKSKTSLMNECNLEKFPNDIPDKMKYPERKLSFIGVDKDEFHRQSGRRHSEKDLNYVDETSSTVSEYIPKQDCERLKVLVQSQLGAFENPGQQVKGSSPHPSGYDLSSSNDATPNLKPVVWVPSKYLFPEVSEPYQPGTSSTAKHTFDVDYILQKPPVLELGQPTPISFMAAERELQTIPENENADSCSTNSSSLGVTQVIHRLRTRVRSIHKDVALLKSRNDRIDKLLDRLVEDITENNNNYEQMQNDIKLIKDRLG